MSAYSFLRRSDFMYPYNIRKPDKSDPVGRLIMSADAATVAEMLIDAINDEARDHEKYLAVSEVMEEPEDAEIIRSIAFDEYKHKRIFEEIYKILTGKMPSVPVQAKNAKVTAENLSEVLTDSFFGELEGVEMYRELMFAFDNTDIRDMIFEVITDEQAHADILNYIMGKMQKSE